MQPHRLENLPKLVGLALGALYFFGFIVVMRHLAEFGATSLALLRLQYVVAGFWLFCPIVVVYATTAGVQYSYYLHARAVSHFLKGNTLSRPRHWLLGLMGFGLNLLPAVLYVLVLVVVVTFGLWKFEVVMAYISSYQQGLAAVFGFSIGIALLGILTWRSARQIANKESEKNKSENIYGMAFFGSLCGLVFIWYVLYFATNIYPHIPHSLGGGKPVSVVFFLKDSKSMTNGPLISDHSGTKSIPYELLLVTDKVYVVKSPSKGQQSIEINRDAVVGMLVLKIPEQTEIQQPQEKSPEEHN